MRINLSFIKKMRFPHRRNLFLAIAVSVLIVSAAVSTTLFVKYGRKAKASVSCDGTGANCTISGAGTFDLVEGQYENSNLTIDQTTVYMWGRHHFKNLTIQNHAIVTHQILVPVNDYNDTTWVLTSNGERKIVDLTIDETLSFKTGGKIDVSGKGYKGGDPHRLDGSYNDCGNGSRCGTGDGPGGGMNADRHDSWPAWGGGGGYGGKGGNGIGNGVGAPGGSPYGDLSSFTSAIWSGSGGGSARMHSGGHADRYVWGARGGGVVKIDSTEIQTDGNSGNGIFAKGETPVYVAADRLTTNTCLGGIVCGGAGSGGSISLRLEAYTNQTGVCATAKAGLYSTAAHTGDPGSVVLRAINFSCSSSALSLSADGGDAGNVNEYGHAASGGGGRVLAERKVNYSLKKVLQAVKRAGVTCNPLDPKTCFDPYSLRLGDTIQVDIYAVRLDSATQIKDNIPKEANSYLGNMYCEPIPASLGDGVYDAGAGTVTWPAVGDSTHTFSYQCKVKN